MKNILTLSMLAVAVLLVGTAGAQETAEPAKVPVGELSKSISGDCNCEKGSACKGECGSSCQCPSESSSECGSACKAKLAGGECQGCHVAAAMAKLPKMTYRVGTEDTCCAKSAAKLAEESKAPIHFVVAEKVYEDKTEAYTSLVEATESMVNEFVTPSSCSKSGTHTVAGKSCKCSVQASKNAELVQTAIQDIKMTYAVGEKSCNCVHEAGTLAKDSGEKMHYVVGEETTCCNMTARLALAKAKYKAALQALAAADAPAAPAAETTTEAAGT